MTLIQSLCAICGAGKTRALARYAKALASNGEKILIVQKTIKLIGSTVCHEIGYTPYSVTVFHCDDNGTGNVSVRLSQHFKDAGPGGEIVVTTHETFAHMPYFEDKEKWHVIVDEIPQIDDMECFNLSETHSIISERVKPTEFNENWYRLEENDGLEALAKNPSRDSLWDTLKGPARKIASDHWDVYALRKSYDALIGGEFVDGEEAGKIEFFSAMRPSIFDGFKSVIIAGANFKKSLLYKVWSAKGFEFKPMPPFLKKHLRDAFRAGKHEKGDLLKIYYAYNSNWSKHRRDQTTALTTGETVERSANIVRVIGEMMGDEEFALMANNDWSNGDFVSWKKAIRMSGSPHGDKASNAKKFTAIETSIFSMAYQAASTAATSNGQQVLVTKKNKDLLIHVEELSPIIRDLLKNQKNECALTGIRLQFKGNHTDSCRLASLDRIDSNKHYEKGNLQIVCRFINKWKSNTPDAEFRRLLDLVRSPTEAI